MHSRQRSVRLGVATGMVVALCAIITAPAGAHGVSSKDALYLLSLNGPAIIPLMYLGAKHMVTGYDINKQTKVTRDKKPAPMNDVKVGGSVVVEALGDTILDLLAIEIRLVPAIPSTQKPK